MANCNNKNPDEAKLADVVHQEIETKHLLADSLMRLARGTPTAFAGLLHDVESNAIVNETKVTAHCHCLKLDGNGRPRIADLVRVVAEHVLDYAIPRAEIREANEEFSRTGSTQKIIRLANEAKSLFTDLKNSGEGGELLLFALAEKILGLPQLICKMSLKTNARMHIHGADGLHAGVDSNTGNLILYWGESKIYGDVTSAVRECLASLAPMLKENAAGQRDLQLLQRHADLDDPVLEAAFKKFLDPDSAEFNSLEFRGLCLIGFDCDTYPLEASGIQIDDIAKNIAQTLPTWKSHVKKRISEEHLDAFSIHFLMIPFPSAELFRKSLRSQLGTEEVVKNSTSSSPATKKAGGKTRKKTSSKSQENKTKAGEV